MEEYYKSIDEYTLIKKLGSGGNGKVYLALNKKNGQECAVKVINRLIQSDKDVIQLKKEFDVISHLKHKNILQAYAFEINGSYKNKDGEASQKVYMATELVRNGE